MHPAPPQGATPAELVQWTFERLNAHDIDSLRQLWSDRTVDHFPHAELRGPDELAQFFGGMIAALPDIQWRLLHVVTQGEEAFVHWEITGTFTGRPFMGFRATGSRLCLVGSDHFHYADGKILTARIVYDQMSFARQLGMLPPDGSVLDRLGKAIFNFRTRLIALWR